MSTEKKTMKFGPACKTFFGNLPGQTLSEFMAELKTLSATDKADLAPLLEKELNVQIELSEPPNTTTNN